MPARITIDRVLRDPDDDIGQSIRDWQIASEPGHVTIRLKHGDGFIMLRAADVETFAADLKLARDTATSLKEEE